MSAHQSPHYHYYEMGLRPGDFMSILNTIELRKLWAIVYDRSENRYEVWVNGEKVAGPYTFTEAEATMQQYLTGQLRIPG